MIFHFYGENKSMVQAQVVLHWEENKINSYILSKTHKSTQTINILKENLDCNAQYLNPEVIKGKTVDKVHKQRIDSLNVS